MKKQKTTKQVLPRGVTEKEIRALIHYYDNQSEEEQVAEIEAAYQANGTTRIAVPTVLVPQIEALVAQADNGPTKQAKRGTRKKSMGV